VTPESHNSLAISTTDESSTSAEEEENLPNSNCKPENREHGNRLL